MQTLTCELALPLLPDADAVARGLGHPYVGAEHLLLAVAENAEGASRAFLARRGLTPEVLRRQVDAVLGPCRIVPAAGAPLALSTRALIALADALRAGRGAAGPYTPDDLLAALLGDDVASGAVVGAVLERAGVGVAEARAELASYRSGGAAT